MAQGSNPAPVTERSEARPNGRRCPVRGIDDGREWPRSLNAAFAEPSRRFQSGVIGHRIAAQPKEKTGLVVIMEIGYRLRRGVVLDAAGNFGQNHLGDKG